MNLCVAGGAGYVGSKLVPALLKKGYRVTVLDLYLYGESVFNDLKPNAQLREIKGDIRDPVIVEKALQGCDHVIHLACISNDPSFELNPMLGKAINFDAFEPFVKKAKEMNIRRFLYASSSSVYGIKDVPNVTEEMPLEPLTDYSRYKVECEKILLRYASSKFICTILRPATVCGYAPRQRLDVVVNVLTNHAYHKKQINVTGGKQLRPNIHIDDMVDAYLHVLEAPAEKIQGEVFNVGFHNHSIQELAQIVASRATECEILTQETDDPRSYHISSEKMARRLGFVPRRTIEDAVDSLIEAFKMGKLPNAMEDKRYYNIKLMKELKLQ